MFGFLLEMLRRIQYFVKRDRLEAELREEMDTHLAMLSAESDPVSAKQRLGNVTRWQEISREAWGWTWLESLARDIGYGARLLAKSPGFTLTASLSLAIGLGATMGMFSLMNALLFKTLPVPEPRQLWQLTHISDGEKDSNFSYPMFANLERANSSGMRLFAVGGDYVQVNYGNSTRNTPTLIVSGNAFRVLRLKPSLGRLLNEDDDRRGLPRGANCVLSYRLWRSQFHSDPSAIGRRISIGVESFRIVGVAPANFFGFDVGAYSDLILPITAYAATNPGQRILEDGAWMWLNLMFRLPPNISAAQLTGGLNAAYPSIRKAVEPSTLALAKPDRLSAESTATGVSVIRGRFSEPLYLLLTMTGLILAIACANLANLLLARSVVRSRELAVRLSIGAKASDSATARNARQSSGLQVIRERLTVPLQAPERENDCMPRSAVRMFLMLLALGVSLRTFSIWAVEPAGQADIRVDTTLVVIPVTVTDAQNRFVLGLEKNDFTLSEDGVAQKVTQFAGENAPISAGLLVDTSGSMGAKIEISRDAVSQFLKTMDPHDEACLIEFGDRAQVAADFSSDAKLIESKLSEVEPQGLTALLDAVSMGLEEMRKAKNTRKALIIISDGGDNNSRYSETEVKDLVRQADVQVYSMGVFERFPMLALSAAESSGPKLLAQLSEQTGGRVFSASTSSDLPAIAARIGIELRNQYVLAYVPSNRRKDGKYRHVEVKVKAAPGLSAFKVRWRLGYYAPTQ